MFLGTGTRRMSLFLGAGNGRMRLFLGTGNGRMRLLLGVRKCLGMHHMYNEQSCISPCLIAHVCVVLDEREFAYSIVFLALVSMVACRIGHSSAAILSRIKRSCIVRSLLRCLVQSLSYRVVNVDLPASRS